MREVTKMRSQRIKLNEKKKESKNQILRTRLQILLQPFLLYIGV